VGSERRDENGEEWTACDPRGARSISGRTDKQLGRLVRQSQSSWPGGKHAVLRPLSGKSTVVRRASRASIGLETARSSRFYVTSVGGSPRYKRYPRHHRRYRGRPTTPRGLRRLVRSRLVADGSRLAYSTGSVIYLMNASGTGERELRTSTQGLSSSPTWAPSGDSDCIRGATRRSVIRLRHRSRWFTPPATYDSRFGSRLVARWHQDRRPVRGMRRGRSRS
jgi:hypothetical protein